MDFRVDFRLVAWGANNSSEVPAARSSTEPAPRLTQTTHGAASSSARHHKGSTGSRGIQEVQLPPCGNDQQGSGGPKSVAAGRCHVCVAMADGSLWACGKGIYGQLGVREHQQVTHFTQVWLTEPGSSSVATGRLLVKQVACSDYHTLALTEGGKVFTWGSNSNAKLGHPVRLSPRYDGCSQPTLVTTLADQSIAVASIACGDAHSVALAENGKVWSWGCTRNGSLNYGQCGHNSHTKPTHTPTPIQALASSGICIRSISCGAFHTLAIDAEGRVYSWGAGEYGELGLGDFRHRASPVRVEAFLDPVRERRGERGRGASLRSVKGRATVREEAPVVVSVSGGGRHTLMLTADGDVYACGYNQHGQCGSGNTENLCYPLRIESFVTSSRPPSPFSLSRPPSTRNSPQLPRPLTSDTAKRERGEDTHRAAHTMAQVVACWSHSLFLTSDGRALACGMGRNGELGRDDIRSRVRPTEVPMHGFPSLRVDQLWGGGMKSFALLVPANANAPPPPLTYPPPIAPSTSPRPKDGTSLHRQLDACSQTESLPLPSSRVEVGSRHVEFVHRFVRFEVARGEWEGESGRTVLQEKIDTFTQDVATRDSPPALVKLVAAEPSSTSEDDPSPSTASLTLQLITRHRPQTHLSVSAVAQVFSECLGDSLVSQPRWYEILPEGEGEGSKTRAQG
ncbi:unnamed protein product [Vitrella brassicaformis CCMP3155]|uniref:RCC1-like domain-containing protein n=1 Tax=Vitrella brassicaformis (strain CCMP3155) TaxID=1169540 RepID=A0A0G4FEC1_VITBC|nr:unnamed protein product [Vitrella brassicaformis CCMP3155]|eukprot:CEM11562.1 unnamed protein product [Vitrella brassicaformis CCMP3155]